MAPSKKHRIKKISSLHLPSMAAEPEKPPSPPPPPPPPPPPIQANTFRYQCNDCDNIFDFVEHQPERLEPVVCPNCNSSSTMSAAQHMDIQYLCDWFMMGVSLSVAPVVDLEVEDVQCVVCNERLRATDSTRRMPCGHLYHPDCIFEWFLNRRNSCPVCRFVLPLKTRDPGPPPPPPPAAATS